MKSDFARRARSYAASRPGRGLPFLIGLVALAVVVIGVVWIVVTALMARSRLNDVKAELTSLRRAISAGDSVRARSLVADIRSHAHSAHELTSGPAWWVASNVPVLGAPLQTSRVIAQQADALGSAVLPGVLRLSDDLSTMPPPKNSRIDLTPLVEARPVLKSAAAAAHRASTEVNATSGSWFGPVSSARDSVASELRRLDGDLEGASRAIQLALPMLGETGPQRYFIGFLNEAESRGGGGIPGAYAIAVADHGQITFEHFGTDTELAGVRADVNLGQDFDARYSQDDPAGVIQNSNISPDFSYAGRIWAGMWRAKTGERVDGAISVDPTALGYMLKVTGPARLQDGTVVTARNVVSLTQKTQYTRFASTSQGDKAKRKAYLVSFARSVSTRLTQGGDVNKLVKALSHAAQERRLVVWNSRSSLEAQLRAANWAGTLGNSFGTPLTGFVVNNAAGSKLDYYLDRTMSYRRADCGSGGSATATFQLTNRAPRSGLPRYVTIRGDKPGKAVRPGDNKLIVTYYASGNAQISAVSLDGRPVSAAALPEGNALATSVTVELPAGATRTLLVTVAEPPAYNGSVQVLRQPLVRPLRVDIADSCG